MLRCVTSYFFPRLIRAARQQAGLSQQELGDLCGVSQSAVAQWEREDTQVKEETVSMVGAALKLSREQLLAITPAAPPVKTPSKKRTRHVRQNRSA